MSVDKFGRFSKQGKVGPPGERGPRGFPGERGPNGVGFDLTPTGDYNLNYKKAKNLGSPEEDQDAVNKIYVSNACNETLELCRLLVHDKINLIMKNLQEEQETFYNKIKETNENSDNDIFWYINEKSERQQRDIMDYLKIEILDIRNNLDSLIDKVNSIGFKKSENQPKQSISDKK